MSAPHHPDGLRLNLGSGPISVDGWVCIDRSPNVLLSRLPFVKKSLRRLGVLAENHMAPWHANIVRADIRSLPYPDGSVQAVYSSHTLEHVFLDDARAVLREAARVLQPGGLIRLALPDSTRLARALVENPDSAAAGWEFNEKLLAHPPAAPKGLLRLVARSGGHVHRWQPTPPVVSSMLQDAGFTDITARDFLQGELPDLASIETRPESFFLEARKL